MEGVSHEASTLKNKMKAVSPLQVRDSVSYSEKQVHSLSEIVPLFLPLHSAGSLHVLCGASLLPTSQILHISLADFDSSSLENSLTFAC